mgnify:FL=1
MSKIESKLQVTEREIFISKLDEKSVEDLLKEIIYRDEMRKIEIEKIRRNSASLVNWLVVTPIVLGLLFLFFWSGLIPNR